MALYVYVVTESHLDLPSDEVYDFMRSLPRAWHNRGIYQHSLEYSSWGTAWEGNAIMELERLDLLNRANLWAESQGVKLAERVDLLNWIDALPYQGGGVTLLMSF